MVAAIKNQLNARKPLESRNQGRRQQASKPSTAGEDFSRYGRNEEHLL